MPSLRRCKRRSPRLLLLTPPLVQTNTPYPATMHLTGFLRSRGYDVRQRDLSIKVVRDVLIEYGGDLAEELLELLAGDAPPEAKLQASEWIDELALKIRDEIDPDFGFSRYAASISQSISDFSEVTRAVRRRGVIDEPLECRLEDAIREERPDLVGVTCPFPGTLVPAFKIAHYLKRNHPEIITVLGGGYVSTELRELNDRRVRKYFDFLQYDEGYGPMLEMLEVAKRLGGGGLRSDAQPTTDNRQPPPVPAFVRPDYDGIDWSEYFDVVETENPMHRLWSVGRWVKLVMARGCYWHKCAFCDVHLPYIECFRMPPASEIVDAMEGLGTRFHFVDEAMPPALIRGVCEEILRRRFKCEWWGNIRFDASFTSELCELMAKAGCVAVTGGLECANDRLLELMNKGITLASARKALKNFHAAGIMVHAYLMYGFPTETEEEAVGALDFVRRLFKSDLIQSAFWHRFALTVHSPIAKDPKRFGIRLAPGPKPGDRIFARNEIAYRERNAPDWTRIGKALDLALYNFMQGRGLNKMIYYWFTISK